MNLLLFLLVELKSSQKLTVAIWSLLLLCANSMTQRCCERTAGPVC
jgi:hypothetical protein